MRPVLVVPLLLLACDGSPEPAAPNDGEAEIADAPSDTLGPEPDALDVESDGNTDARGFDGSPLGPWNAALTRLTITHEDRTIPVTIWGPTQAEPSEVTIADLLPARSDEYATLTALAPAGCPSSSVLAAVDAEISPGSWPLVVYSHCHECLGVSGATIALTLASWGHVVIVPDHTGNTLWDNIDGTSVELGGEFLEVRGADVIAILDQALAGDSPFDELAASVDPSRVALVGHSFGAVTVGWVTERDPRVGAAVALAAPIENPLIPGVTAANITTPMMFLVAEEDGSITEFGNVLMRQNFESVAGPALKIELADAGHWSVSDLCGLTDAFMPGCGDATRQTNGEPFTYLTPADGRAITAAWVTAFVGDKLGSVAGAGPWLAGQNDPRIKVETRASE